MFKKGDKLVVVDTRGLGAGDNLTVGEFVTATQDFREKNETIGFIRANGEKDYGYFAYRFELVKPQRAPQEGDKVVIIAGHDNFHGFALGTEVTLTSDKQTSGNYLAQGIGERYQKGQLITQYISEKHFQLAPPKLDFTKSLFTAEGTPVVFVTDKGRDPKFPVLAYEGKAKSLSKFTVEGVHSSGEARRNLTNTEAKPEPVKATVYVNFYSDGTTGNFPGTREKADSMAAAVEKSGQRKRIGVTKVELEEGKFDA